MRALYLLLAALAVVLSSASCGKREEPRRMNLGYFPNVTHAQALIGISRGDFAADLGEDVPFKPVGFNAGPAAIEAIFAGHVDVVYIGPSPTINGFLKSDGAEVRLIAGSAENGIIIVGNKARGITSLAQLKGARVATPQRANTQDISARHYIAHTLGFPIGRGEGFTEVIPMPNPDIENLFQKNQLDAAWVPEPWGARMEEKGLVNIIAEEKDLWESGHFPLTCIIARASFLEAHPDLVEKVLRTHKRLTAELNGDVAPLLKPINDQIHAVTKKRIPDSVLITSLARCRFTIEPDAVGLERFFEKGRDLLFYRNRRLDLDRLVDDRILRRIKEQP
jgi:NitT/TauT family transport system substrate-binding protein